MSASWLAATMPGPPFPCAAVGAGA
eukprot:COSAG06_NODE_7248_length_2571_cov_12.293689_5_plen_24_part_01